MIKQASEMQRFHDKTESQVDLALAYRLALYGVDPADIEHALRWRRAKVVGRPKSDGYFPHTVAKALQALSTDSS